MTYPANMASHGPLRSLEDVLMELTTRFDALPLTHPGRADLARRIRECEAAIEERTI